MADQNVNNPATAGQAEQKNPTSIVNINDSASGIIEVKKPNIMLGISTYNPKPQKEDWVFLDEKLERHPHCEACGAKITKEMRHALHSEGAWFNSCGMCFYPQNLDLIPYFEKGELLYFPAMKQERLNTLLRAVWSVDLFSRLGVSDREFSEFRHATSEIVDKVNGQLHGMTVYFDSTNIEVFIASLDLLRPEEYAQRHKLLLNFRWYPKKEIFKNEIPYWAQHDFSQLHPSKIDDNITTFMAKYKNNDR